MESGLGQLVDMREWADDNDGYKYMLNAVDVFSRYAFSRPLKTKTAIDTFAAFIDMIEVSGRQPKALWVDEGKEFYNSVFKQMNGLLLIKLLCIVRGAIIRASSANGSTEH